MTRTIGGDRLKLADGHYRYYRRVPARFARVDPRRFVEIGLSTTDAEMAARLVPAIDAAQERLWRALAAADAARAALEAAIETARCEAEGSDIERSS